MIKETQQTRINRSVNNARLDACNNLSDGPAANEYPQVMKPKTSNQANVYTWSKLSAVWTLLLPNKQKRHKNNMSC